MIFSFSYGDGHVFELVFLFSCQSMVIDQCFSWSSRFMRDMLLYASFQCSCEFVPDGVDVGVVFCHRLDSLVECCNVFLHAVPSSLLVEGDLPGCLGMGGRAEVKLNKDNIVVRYAGHCSDLLYFTRKV